MVRIRFAPFLLACLSAVPASAQPAAPAPQKARWHLDGATDRCVLTRELQGASGSATFVLRTVPGSRQYDVILAGDGLARNFGRRAGEARIGFAASAAAHLVPAGAIEMPGGLGRAVILSRIPEAFVTELAAGSTLRLMDKEGAELGSWTVPTGAKAVEALAFCETEKQVEWGADRAAFETGAAPPRPASDPQKWVSIRDFGAATVLTSARYTALFRLLVDEKGAPSDCKLIEFAGAVEIEPSFCRTIVRIARYEPARDPRGNPVRSVAVHALTF